jgi:hypothetical protein
MGHKGILGINPTNSGQFQIAIEDYVEGEKLYLSEGTTEIQLPAQILDPLDARFETLLSSNGELVVRRGADERARVSLAGFRQTLSYLKWVAARQDYAALPYGWPVPNSGTAAPARLTAAETWTNPMAQSQTTPVAVPEVSAAPAITGGAEVDALRREVETLRSLISLSAPPPVIPEVPPPQIIATPEMLTVAPVTATDQADTARIVALQGIVAKLSVGLAPQVPCGSDPLQPCPASESAFTENAGITPTVDRSPADTMPGLFVSPVLPTFESSSAVTGSSSSGAGNQTAASPSKTSQRDQAAKIDYLMTEIGLDVETAMMVLQLGQIGLDQSVGANSACSDSTLNLAFSDEMTRQALADLVEPLARSASPVSDGRAAVGGADNADLAETAVGSGTEYVFLSDYLQAIFRPIGGK